MGDQSTETEAPTMAGAKGGGSVRKLPWVETLIQRGVMPFLSSTPRKEPEIPACHSKATGGDSLNQKGCEGRALEQQVQWYVMCPGEKILRAHGQAGVDQNRELLSAGQWGGGLQSRGRERGIQTHREGGSVR